MEKMFIKKGGVVIIGDTLTGNHETGVRFFDYSLREAIKKYRKDNNLIGVHFKRVYCSAIQFGYCY